RGQVTVELTQQFFEVLSAADPSDPILAVAQIVLTMTRLSGISSVRFTIDGEPVEVPLADASSSEPGQWLFHDDYRQVLDDPVTPATTTTTAPSSSVSSPPGG
ncbi:MAG TPA: GerMN domain-containing protein, partial [Ilumatobacteraceae bacterium]|nr:GerMN domain-containing protein [Ilumatobacteraceae bacterium]